MRTDLPKGLGWYLYRPERCMGGDMLAVVRKVKEFGGSWIAPRVLGWCYFDKRTEPFMDALAKACSDEGIRLGGWGYHVILDANNRPVAPPVYKKSEAQAVIDAVERWGLDFYVVNSEKELKGGGVPWSGWQARDTNKLRKYASAFWRELRSGLPDLCIGMTSYRFPKLHREFLWDIMLDKRYVDFNQPQVYWEMEYREDRPRLQALVSKKEFDDMGFDLPYVPLFSCYPRGTWKPTPAQLMNFASGVEEIGVPGYGGYALDFVDDAQWGAIQTMWKPSTGVLPPVKPENPAEPPLELPRDALERLWKYAIKQRWEV